VSESPMAHGERNGGRSGLIRPGAVATAVDAMLPTNLEGTDAVRAAVARRLAAELDAPDVQAYAVARLSGALLTALSALDAEGSVRASAPARTELRQLLRDVTG